PVVGRWELRPDLAAYIEPEAKTAPAEFGLAIADDRSRLRSGRIRATVVFPRQRAEGRIVFGRNAATGAYFSAGIGGHGFGYVLNEFIPTFGRWRPLRWEGSEANIVSGTPYRIEVLMRGQKVKLFVNGVNVLEGDLPYPMSGDQIGLFAWG